MLKVQFLKYNLRPNVDHSYQAVPHQRWSSRHEHIKFSDKSGYKGAVTAVEYLGTTQIVTLSTANGVIKSRIDSGKHVKNGETIGLEFDARTLTLFDNANGRALKSKANERVFNNG